MRYENNQKVLIIEDDYVNFMLLKDNLKKFNIRLIRAINITDALVLLSKHEISHIIFSLTGFHNNLIINSFVGSIKSTPLLYIEKYDVLNRFDGRIPALYDRANVVLSESIAYAEIEDYFNELLFESPRLKKRNRLALSF